MSQAVQTTENGQAGASAPSPVTVVGIGASAGGLAGLKSFFAHVPQDSHLAYVVVVHLSPEHESHLPDLLQPHCPVPVRQVTETLLLEPDNIYVIPPGANLSTIDTHLRLSELEKQRRQRAPIDHFFRTLAATHDGNAIAVVLTGTGADGSLGIKEIKIKGGLTVAQDPAEAEYDGMPQSAIATGLVDLILPVEAMPERILQYVRTQPRVTVPDDGEDPGTERHFLQKILADVRSRTGRDFSQYKRSTIMRRIRRRMQIHRVEELDQYLDLLRAEQDEPRALADEFLITVSNFFRDREVFEQLEREVIPRLFEGKGPTDQIRVWSVGCATGEEAYSLAMLMIEDAGRRENPPQIQIFASDLHERSLKLAREGFYSGEIQTDVSPERVRRFFTQDSNGYHIRKEVRELVVFTQHNLMGDPPFSKMDLITCRNVFIYLQRDIQQKIIRLFHYAINPGGYLLLGTSETLDLSDLFSVVDKKCCLYQKRNVPSHEPNLPFFPLARMKAPGRLEAAPPAAVPVSYGGLHQKMVERYAPPSILVNQEFNVVHLSEHAGRYLVHPGGEPTSSIFKVVREELRIELRAALHLAEKEGRAVRSRSISTLVDGAPRGIALEVRPADDREQAGFFLIIFEEHQPEQADAPDAPAATPSLSTAHELETELELTKERLQGIIEDYETGQEEMKASNEELQSINEEMRSMMEELETSKEELQSMNEELQTANQENRHKVVELSQLTADLQSLMAATDIATIFLDCELRILRFTPPIEELFNIRSSDRARPISDLTHRLGYQELGDDARRVLARLAPVEREVRDDQGRWYLTRILPYRTAENRIEGVVITFVDITRRKESEDALRASEERYRTLFHSMDEAFMVLEQIDAGPDQRLDFRIVEANSAFEKTTGLSDVAGRTMREVMDDVPAWIETYANVVATGESIRFQDQVASSGRWLDFFVWRTGGPDSRRVGILFSDVTHRKEAEEALRASEGHLRELSRSLEMRVALRTTELEEKHHRLRRLAVELASTEQRERKRLAAILHDDLQQLLVASLLHVREAAESSPTESAARAMAKAERLLDQAIARAHGLTLQLRPPVLYDHGLIAAVKWLGDTLLERYGVRVSVDADEAEPVLDDDFKALLFECCRELFFNAAKHAGVHEIFVELHVEDDQLHLVVRDEGSGFDPQSAAKDHNGGFGLFSIRERMIALGCTMRIETAPGKGTRIDLVMPLASPGAADPGAKAAESPEASFEPWQEPESGHRPRVLVVDDHTIVRQGITHILTTDDRVSVVGEAADGIEAIEAVERFHPDAVLMDINMPRMNGVEATREISRRWPGVNVIGLSVHDDEATAHSILNAGASAFTTKAGNSEYLIETILRLTRREISSGPEK